MPVSANNGNDLYSIALSVSGRTSKVNGAPCAKLTEVILVPPAMNDCNFTFLLKSIEAKTGLVQLDISSMRSTMLLFTSSDASAELNHPEVVLPIISSSRLVALATSSED